MFRKPFRCKFTLFLAMIEITGGDYECKQLVTYICLCHEEQ